MSNPKQSKYSDISSPLVGGLQTIIKNFVHLPLTEQSRCGKDPIHTELLISCRNADLRFPLTEEILRTLRGMQLTRERM